MTDTLKTEPKPAGSRAARVQQIVSPGGIAAWLVEDYTVPLVAVEFAFHGGASQDPSAAPGVATLLAGLLDEGAGPYDSEAFHRILEEYAIEISFSAERDLVVGRMQTLARNKAKAFELLALAVAEARLDLEPLERVKSQIAAGLKREINDPDSVASRAFRRTAYAGHPYGAPIRGDLATIDSLSRSHIADFRAANLARDNLKIAVVGAIDAQALGTYLDDVFGKLPANSSLLPVPDIAFAGAGTQEIVDIDLPQSTIRFGRQGIGRDDKDYIPATVVNHVLGGGVFSARLFREVREKRGLAYSVYSQLATHDHAAMLYGGTSTKNERAAESLQVIQGEIRSLSEAGPTPEELDKAKKYLVGSYALRFDSSTKIAAHLVRLQADGYGVDYLDARNGLIDAVTLEDAQRAAKRLFGDGALLVAVAGRPVGF
ncbi:MAG: M16 family metallopeptidase [Methylovirgula sp.]